MPFLYNLLLEKVRDSVENTHTGGIQINATGTWLTGAGESGHGTNVSSVLSSLPPSL